MGYVAQAEAEGSIAIGFDNRYGGPARSSADHSIALGGGANASLKNSAAIGSGSVTSYDFTKAQTSMTLDGNTYNFAGNPTEENGIISVGNFNTQLQRVITNVAPGRISSDSTDAINGSQLYGTNRALEALSRRTVKYDMDSDGKSVDQTKITLAGNGGTTISNVADTDIAGDSTNAVNSRTVYKETRVSNDGIYIRKDNSAAQNIEALDHQVALNGIPWTSTPMINGISPLPWGVTGMPMPWRWGPSTGPMRELCSLWAAASATGKTCGTPG